MIGSKKGPSQAPNQKTPSNQSQVISQPKPVAIDPLVKMQQ